MTSLVSQPSLATGCAPNLLTVLAQPGGTDSFRERHVGPTAAEQAAMLKILGCGSLGELIDQAVPAGIRLQGPLPLPNQGTEGQGQSSEAALQDLRAIANQNQVWRSYLGLGYHNCLTPAVIQRNILENPGWYTQYTPYQAEIAQGRLEALLNFQTLITELTGLPLANASLLDEATAAAEAMTMSYQIKGKASKSIFLVDQGCHPQTIAVLQTRAEPLGIQLVIGDTAALVTHPALVAGEVFGGVLAYPATDGLVAPLGRAIAAIQAGGGLVTLAVDLLSLTLLKSPGELGADIAVGSSQRFGVPLGFGGPHAAFFATRDQYSRQLPGRLVGVSQDVSGQSALRLALQTREQHIRRDRATSNICTAQVLLAIMAGMYAVYHGPQGLQQIASRIHTLARLLAHGCTKVGHKVTTGTYFDTVRVELVGMTTATAQTRAAAARINLRALDAQTLAIALDETVTLSDLEDLWHILAGEPLTWTAQDVIQELGITSLTDLAIAPEHQRQTAYMTQPVFQRYHSETELLRYIHRLQSKDLSLTTSMIPLGSCTMKLNATTEMLPVSWPEFSQIHPFAPAAQTEGYRQLCQELEAMLAAITGFAAVSLQPNAGSQGEYAGLLTIRAYHQQRGAGDRHICLIPQSAHGTNPASAVMAGMKVVPVACDRDGNIDVADLRQKAEQHSDRLAALMITYPSTHGVFEASIREVCTIIHDHGGQVYMDGANLNAQVGICRPADFGADVCHLNLHKTFCIPHGGGGPGVGPIGVQAHLAPFLPGHPLVNVGGEQAIGPVAAAPWGSASILPIPWLYIRLMGAAGLTHATEVAILNANYVAKRLGDHYPILYRGQGGWVAHECILDLRSFKTEAGIEVEDVAKRLMDYGFHAPTISWPVAGTMMVEPTESEAKGELDRFCEAMIAIREEIRAIATGQADPQDNPLKHAPHTAAMVSASHWDHAYTREEAAYPAPWVKEHKFWPSIRRVNNAYGDRNLVCTCPPLEAYS